MKSDSRRSIQAALVRRTIFVCFALICLETSFRAWLDYKGRLESVRRVFTQVESATVPGITASMWDFDREQLDLQVSALTHFPYITWAAAEASPLKSEHGFKPAHGLAHHVTLKIERRGKEISIGELELEADLDQIRSTVLWDLTRSILSESISVTIAGIIFLVLYERTVTSHLREIARFVRVARPEEKDEVLNLSRSHGYNDELTEIVGAINAHNGRLRRTHALIRQHEHSLAASERELNAIVENAPIGIAIVRDRTFLKANRTACEILGYSQEELTRISMRQFYQNDQEYERAGQLLYVENGKVMPSVEVVAAKKDGTLVNLAIKLAPLGESSSTPMYVCIIQDISMRLSAARALKEKERQLETLLNNLPGMAFRCAATPGWPLEFVSRGAQSLTGYPPEEFHTGKVGLDIISFPGERPNPNVDVADNQQSYQMIYRIRTRDDETRWVLEQGQGVYTALGELVALEGLVIDITQQKRLETELRVSEQKYRHIFENATEGIFQLTAEGDYKAINPALARMRGYDSPEEMIRLVKDISQQVYANPDERKTVREALLKNGRIRNYELEVVKKDGEKIWILLNAHVVRDQNNNVDYVEGTNLDITELKKVGQLQAAKARAEAANRAKSTFLAKMSHEIRTPMNAIVGFSHLLLREPGLTPKQREYVEIIDRNGDHLLGIITDILDMARIDANRVVLAPTKFSVSSMVLDLQSTITTRAQLKGIRFDVETEAGIPETIVADQVKTRQILINLVGNAIKFTAQGRVTLRVRCPRGDEPADSIYWEVEDSGCGIATEDLERVFEPFEQTESGQRGGGTGLGLPISREFARQMQGDVTATSELGRGSIFRLMLPIISKTEALPPLEPTDSEFTLTLALQRKHRVLVVDDIEDNRQLIKELLSNSGFEVFESASGEEALQIDLNAVPDIILVDAKMPGMDGIETISRIRQRRGDAVQIIMLSASVFTEDRAQSLAAGADDFISKPFRKDEFFRKLAKLLPEFNAVSQTSRAIRDAAPDRSPEYLKKVISPEAAGKLRDALLEADLDRIYILIDRLNEADPLLASEMRQVASSFRYEDILKMLACIPS